MNNKMDGRKPLLMVEEDNVFVVQLRLAYESAILRCDITTDNEVSMQVTSDRERVVNPEGNELYFCSYRILYKYTKFLNPNSKGLH